MSTASGTKRPGVGTTTVRTYDDRPATCASCVHRRGRGGLRCERWGEPLQTGGEPACVAFVGWGR